MSPAATAQLLRNAVEDFEDGALTPASAAAFCIRVLNIADRVDPPLRLVDGPVPARGARRLNAAMGRLEGAIRG